MSLPMNPSTKVVPVNELVYTKQVPPARGETHPRTSFVFEEVP